MDSLSGPLELLEAPDQFFDYTQGYLGLKRGEGSHVVLLSSRCTNKDQANGLRKTLCFLCRRRKFTEDACQEAMNKVVNVNPITFC